jgi:hypothetical protein
MSELKDDLLEPAAPAPKAAALVAAHIRKLIVKGELAEGRSAGTFDATNRCAGRMNRR